MEPIAHNFNDLVHVCTITIEVKSFPIADVLESTKLLIVDDYGLLSGFELLIFHFKLLELLLKNVIRDFAFDIATNHLRFLELLLVHFKCVDFLLEELLFLLSLSALRIRLLAIFLKLVNLLLVVSLDLLKVCEFSECVIACPLEVLEFRFFLRFLSLFNLGLILFFLRKFDLLFFLS